MSVAHELEVGRGRSGPATPPAIKTVCAWCGAVIHDGPGVPVSHGICAPCRERVLLAGRDQEPGR